MIIGLSWLIMILSSQDNTIIHDLECIPIDFHGLQIWENFLQSPIRYFQMVKAQKKRNFP
ncbi:MAG: hypothetical protein SO118_05860 [Candidatus Onthomorpha sp.]|nr:hypothetical protein [Candidatus Onthomorpha sp.]